MEEEEIRSGAQSRVETATSSHDAGDNEDSEEGRAKSSTALVRKIYFYLMEVVLF